MSRALIGFALVCLFTIPWLDSLWLEAALALFAFTGCGLVVYRRKENIVLCLILMAACPVLPFVKWFEGALASKAQAAPLRALNADLDLAEKTVSQFFINNDAILNSIAILAAQQEDIQSNIYHSWLSQLLPEQRNQFLNVALSSNLVVRQVYPLNSSNQAVLGVNLNAVPGQGPYYRSALLTQTNTLIGPVMLLQGFPGIIYVHPVAGPDQRLVSGVLALDRLRLALQDDGAADTGLTVIVSGAGQTYPLVGGLSDTNPTPISRLLNYQGIQINLAMSSVAINQIATRSNVVTRLGAFGFWLCLSVVLAWQHMNFVQRERQSGALQKNEFELMAAQRLGQMGSWWRDEGERIQLSEPLQELLNYPTADMAVGDFLALLHPDERAQTASRIRAFTGTNGDHLSLEHRVKIGDQFRWFEHRLAKNDATRFTGYVRDIHNLRKRDEQVAQLESNDSLTGVANRHYFKQLTLKNLAVCARRQSHLALLLVNVDDFRAVNEKYGQLAGDELLIQITQRLILGSRKSDCVARLSGDTFAIALVDIDKNKQSIIVVEKLLHSLKEPYQLDADIYPQLTMGVSMYPDDAQDYEQLLQMAESALSSAKTHARGNYRYYSPRLTRENDRRQQILSSLPAAIRNNYLRLVYQPRVSGGHPSRVHSMEALLRWHDPVLGIVSPGEFIPIAEQTALISDIGYWVLEEVFAMMAHSQHRLPANLSISINLSPKQLEDLHLVAAITGLLGQYGVRASQFELEITEYSISSESEAMMDNMRALSNMGFKFALDDFGTGYSNLGILQSLPLNVLKVDITFIRAIGTSVKSDELVRAILKMGHTLGLRVVAEGVESAEQVRFLSALDCEELQGYYFFKPKPIEELLERFKRA